MAGIFPSKEWLEGFMDYLNANEKYSQVAKNWEGDLLFQIQPDETLNEEVLIYLDLWHGKCRGVEYFRGGGEKAAAFILVAKYANFVKVLKGSIDPMQAMLTRKLMVKGNMAVMMRNVPTVLEFVRCAQAVTDKVIGE